MHLRSGCGGGDTNSIPCATPGARPVSRQGLLVLRGAALEGLPALLVRVKVRARARVRVRVRVRVRIRVRVGLEGRG